MNCYVEDCALKTPRPCRGLSTFLNSTDDVQFSKNSFVSDPCAPCTCVDGRMNCNRLKLTAVPPNIPSDTKHLDLQSNRITSLRGEPGELDLRKVFIGYRFSLSFLFQGRGRGVNRTLEISGNPYENSEISYV